MVSYGHAGTHRQGRASLGTPTPETPGTTPGAAVPMPRSQSDQRGAMLAAQGASRWQIAHARPRPPGADTGHTAQEVLTLAPDRTGPQGRIEGLVKGHEAGMEPRDRGLAIRVEAARCTPEAVLLRRPPGEALPPPGEARTPFLRLRVGNRAGRGADRLRTVGQGAGIAGSGLGPLAGGLRTITGLTWVDHHDGPGRCSPRGHHRALEPSRGFEPPQCRAAPVSRRDEVRDARVIVGNGPAGPWRTQGHVTRGFGNSNTHNNRR